MKLKKASLIIVGILLLFGTANAYVGTAPGLQDLGTLERGQTYEAHFYILTDRQSSFIINPSFTEAHSSILREEKKNNYDFNPKEASEEDMESWVEFSRESYSVDPDDVRVIQLDGGGVARASQKVTYEISVSQDAEPGYHVGAVNLNPDFNPNGEGAASLETVGLTQFNYVFRVPGEAERDLNIIDVNGKRVSDDKVRVDFLMKNNGTVTTWVESAETEIYNEVGNKTEDISITGDTLAPGETRIVKTYWNDQDIDAGEYRVEGQMSYITGSSYIDSSIDVPEQIEIQPSDNSDEESGVPLWLVAMALLLIGAAMYYFEISPVTIAGTLGIGLVVLATLKFGLPVYIPGILLLLAAGITIYRWL